MSEDERGESYLEIQMDRSTIVVAALGILGLVVAAFFVGRWTAPAPEAPAGAAPAVAAGDEAAPDDAADGEPGTDEQDVDALPHFGERPVSAREAPPLTAVPAPRTTPSSGGSASATKSPPAASPSTTATRRPAPQPATSASGASTPAKAAAGAQAGGPWIVQVAASKSSQEAETLRNRLAGKGHPVRIMNEGGYFKVQVGPYDAKSEAEAAERRLKREEGLATWLKKP